MKTRGDLSDLSAIELLRWKRGSAFARAFIVSLCCDDTVQPAAA